MYLNFKYLDKSIKQALCEVVQKAIYTLYKFHGINQILLCVRGNKYRLSVYMVGFDQQYLTPVVGVDEVGRGALVGPVVAAAVMFDQVHIISGIKDSKKLTRKQRSFLYEQITKNYIWSVGIVYQDEIDTINILEATKKACVMAVTRLLIQPVIVLVDGNMKFNDARFVSIIKGDQLSLAIGAASIVAKVTRDRLMQQYAKEFPKYNWHKNYGYATREHLQAIKLYGLTPYHRRSFKIKSKF